MYLVPIAWMYVVLMMTVAEATNPSGTVLGAAVTFVLYGLLPVSILLYLMATPARKRAIRARQAAQEQAWALAQQTPPPVPDTAGSGLAQPDAGGHAATDAVAPVREKP